MPDATAKPMSDAEYLAAREQIVKIIAACIEFDAWRFKHEAKKRGERDLGQWVWAIHLEALAASV